MSVSHGLLGEDHIRATPRMVLLDNDPVARVGSLPRGSNVSQPAVLLKRREEKKKSCEETSLSFIWLCPRAASLLFPVRASQAVSFWEEEDGERKEIRRGRNRRGQWWSFTRPSSGRNHMSHDPWSVTVYHTSIAIDQSCSPYKWDAIGSRISYHHRFLSQDSIQCQQGQHAAQ